MVLHEGELISIEVLPEQDRIIEVLSVIEITLT